MATDDYSADINTDGLLVVGESAQGALETGGDRDWFKVYLTSGTSYYFTMSGGGDDALRDAHLYLYDSLGESVTDNDDSGGILDSRIVYTASSTGHYYLAAGSYQDSQSGTYRLAAGEYVNEYSSHTPGSLQDGGSLTGELQVLGDIDWVKAELTAGTTYTISLRGSDSGNGTLGDPYLYLYDLEGGFAAGDDDGSGRRDSVLTYTPTASGSYYLGVGAYQNASTGTYTLGMTSHVEADDYTAGLETTGRVEVGGSATGTLERNGDRDWLAVDLVAGEIYYFDLKGSPAGDGGLSDAYLYLYDSQGNRIAFNDDGGQGLNSRIVFTATNSGTYYLSAAGFDDQETGSYALSVGKLPDSQKEGTGHITGYGLSEGDLESGEHDWVTVSLEAATTYLITLESDGDEGALANATLELRDAFGGSVATGQDDGDSTSRSIAFTADADGTYYVDIGSLGENDSGHYLLSIVGRQTDEFNQAANTGDWSADNLFEPATSNMPGLASDVVYASQGGDSMAGDGEQTASSLTISSQDGAAATVAAQS